MYIPEKDPLHESPYHEEILKNPAKHDAEDKLVEYEDYDELDAFGDLKLLNEKYYELDEDYQKLEEMSIRGTSSLSDGLPFRVVVQIPDAKHKFDHAHTKDLQTGKKEMGIFLVTKNPPKSASDIKDSPEHKDYPVSDEMRKLIFKWSRKKNFKYHGTNWQALQYECDKIRNDTW